LPIDREFITAYLRDEGRLKIHHRRELARQLNITTDSLRKSVFKIKSKLKDINTCIATKLMSKVELTDTDISVLTPTIDSALQTLAANQKQINLDRGQTKTLRQEAKTIIFRILETLEPDR
jgi:uncharacterized coiled-coil DUF342 family protein